jgi:ABC-type transport system involved in multi-copper enzyme maturation permease subunit
MSTTAYAPAAPGGLSRDARPGMGRLIRVELRKMYDTRAGFWLLASAVLLAALVAGIVVFAGHDDERNFRNALDGATQVMNVLLPVVGILLVTSEWSQRTAQVTFTLVPQRDRVLVAKIGAAVVVALAAFVVALALAALFTALGGEGYNGRGAWSMDGALIPQTALFYVISMLIGVALGAAILLSAPAIVASFALPIGVALILGVTGADKVSDWVDQGSALSPLSNHGLSGHEWAQALVCTLLWFGVPIAVGLYRFMRNEVR